MNPKIKARWIEALRSGNYRQGKEFLRVKDKFCCLGVLWDVCGCTWEDRGTPNLSPARGGHVLNEYVPLEARLSSYDALVQMNDSGKPFSVIADFIEGHL